MTAALTPYVPRLVLEWARDTPAELHRRIDGTLVFADVSGFTAMSERLATLGRLGAEELTQHLDEVFSELLDVAADRGGSLLKFGGDALLLFFWGDDHPVRGVAAAAEMRACLRRVGRRQTSAGPVRLRMSMGAHSGSVDFFLVGDAHRDLIVGGPAASTVVAMEGIADAGEIVITPAMAACLPRSAAGAAKGEGVLLARAPKLGTVSDLVLAPADIDASAYLPKVLRAFLASDINPEGEHRWLTIAFTHIEGVDRALAEVGPDETAAALSYALGAFQNALASHGVCQLDCDVYNGGPKALAVSGAPTAQENDTERMLRALRDAGDATAAGPLRLRSGVNYGPAFVGPVGPSFRRTYTVMGDAVNTAARVMAHARAGELLGLASVLDHTQVVFESEERPPFTAKGKAVALRPYLIGAPTGLRSPDRSAVLPFTGRGDELALLTERLASARLGAGAVVDVAAAAGFGKTRLVDEFVALCGTEVIRATGDGYQLATPFAGARPLLWAALGVEGDVRDHLLRLVPGSAPWLPLVGAALGVDLGSTPEVEALDPQFASLRLAVVIGELLEAARRPLVWFVDDGHLLDDASSQLLARLFQAAPKRPWLVCITRRPEPGSLVIAGAHQLDLAPLDPSASAALVRVAGGDRLTPTEVSAVVERGGGNPLFLRDLAISAVESGSAGDLPDHIETLIATRIDQLGPARRAVIRAAAVLGPSFSVDLLERLAPGWRLAGLEEFVEIKGGTMRFRHRLDQETAYRGMSFRRRQDLHRFAGELIEHGMAAPADAAEILSLHFAEGREWAKAWTYGMVAGARAKEAYANFDAATFFERAVKASAHLRDVNISEGWFELALALQTAGRQQQAIDTVLRARRVLRGDPIGIARLSAIAAESAGRLGDAAQAVRVVQAAVRNLRSDVALEAAHRGRLLAIAAYVYRDAGKTAQAMRAARRAVDEATRSGDPRALAISHLVLCQVLTERRQLDEAAESYEVASRFLTEVGSVRHLVGVHSVSALAKVERNDWRGALESYAEASRLATEIGDIASYGLLSLNRATIMTDQGRLAEAAELLDDARVAFTQVVYQVGLIVLDRACGRVLALRGQVDEGCALLSRSIATLERVGLTSFALRGKADLAEILAVAGRFDDARALADEVVSVTLNDGDDGARHARALRAIGLAGGGTDAFRRSLRAGDESPYEQALTLVAWGASDAAGLAPEGWEETSAATFQELGVVWILGWPIPPV